MIFLDGDAFIREAVASLRAQDDVDWELLLVDDGSTDGSSAYARALAEAEPGRFRYLSHAGHANRGTSASRNVALSAARGEFLFRLDCDDVLASNSALREQVALLDAHPDVALVCGPCEYWNGWRGGRDTLQPLATPPGRAEPTSLLAAMLVDATQEPISMLVRTQAIRDAGGWEESIRDFGEDFILTSKLLLRGAAWVSPACWYRYRMHPASYSHRMRDEGRERGHRQRVVAWTRAWLRREGVRDRALHAAVAARARMLRRHPLREAFGQLKDGLRWQAWRLRLAYGASRASARAWLRIDAEPAAVGADEACFRVRASWQVEGPAAVQVRIGAPDGPAFTSGAARGEAWTNDWVRRRMLFFLQDANAKDPTSPEATLAVQRAWVPLRRTRADA